MDDSVVVEDWEGLEKMENFRHKQDRQIKILEFERDKMKSDIEFSHKPLWLQMQEEGDWTPYDAGMAYEADD